MSLERAAWGLLMLHVMVSLFGLVGIAIMVPNPELWTGSDMAVSLFPVAVQQGGNLQILLGAVAVMVYGAAMLGWRPTLIFFTMSVSLSLGFELAGTSVGIPFGNYEYTDMFGYKILDKVPPAIPLSWFFMGFTSFALATGILRKWLGSASLWPSIILGSLLLIIWDMVLDPAMSHETLAIRYWYWEDVGPYMGIPLINFVGWMITGVVFMFAASYFDERLRPIRIEQDGFFMLVYMCNLFFALGICAGNQFWLPTILGGIFAALILFAWFKPGFGVSALQKGA